MLFLRCYFCSYLKKIILLYYAFTLLRNQQPLFPIPPIEINETDPMFQQYDPEALKLARQVVAEDEAKARAEYFAQLLQQGNYGQQRLMQQPTMVQVQGFSAQRSAVRINPPVAIPVPPVYASTIAPHISSPNSIVGTPATTSAQANQGVLYQMHTQAPPVPTSQVNRSIQSVNPVPLQVQAQSQATVQTPSSQVQAPAAQVIPVNNTNTAEASSTVVRVKIDNTILELTDAIKEELVNGKFKQLSLADIIVGYKAREKKPIDGSKRKPRPAYLIAIHNAFDEIEAKRKAKPQSANTKAPGDAVLANVYDQVC